MVNLLMPHSKGMCGVSTVNFIHLQAQQLIEIGERTTGAKDGQETFRFAGEQGDKR